MRLAPDARITFGLMMTAMLSLAAFLWLGFGALPPSSVERRTSLSRTVRDRALTEFVDVTEDVGLYDFRHDTEGVNSIEDTVGPGLALVDLDLDDDLDLILLGGPGGATGVSVFLNRLREEGTLRFSDETAAMGITWRGAAQGICVGDYDNDDVLDVFVTALGPNLLLRGVLEDGRLSFRDVTAEAGVAGGEYSYVPGPAGSVGQVVAGPRWERPSERVRSADATPTPVKEFSTGASFGDYDGDGFLDLYVANYVSYHPDFVEYGNTSADRSEAPQFAPTLFPAQPDRLYHNEGDGTFREVTQEAGIEDADGRGLTAAFLLMDSDRDPDLFVANAGSPNRAYHNLGPAGSPAWFEDVTTAWGLDDVRSSHGIAHADADADGDLDLLVTHWSEEPASLYLYSLQGSATRPRERGIRFEDRGPGLGISEVTEPLMGWGVLFLDYDNDGYEDLLVASGLARPSASGLDCVPEPLVLLRSLSGSRFVDVTGDAGEALQQRYAARGLVSGDLDLDGDVDVVMAQNNGRPVVLQNRLPAEQRHPLRITVRLYRMRRDAIGTLVLVDCGGRRRVKEFMSGGSFLSQGPSVLYFGLGNQSRVELLLYQFPPAYAKRHGDFSQSSFTPKRTGEILVQPGNPP